MLTRVKKTLLWAVALLVVIAGGSFAQKAGGVFTAGDIWESFLPSNAGRYYGEAENDPLKSWVLFRVGHLHATSLSKNDMPKNWRRSRIRDREVTMWRRSQTIYILTPTISSRNGNHSLSKTKAIRRMLRGTRRFYTL